MVVVVVLVVVITLCVRNDDTCGCNSERGMMAGSEGGGGQCVSGAGPASHLYGGKER